MAGVLASSAHAMGVTFTMIASGTALRATGVVSAAGQREMAQVAVKLLMPAFNFSALITDVSWERLQACRWVVAFAGVHVLMGLVLGAMLCRLGARGSPFLRDCRAQVLVLCAFPNATAMPLPLFRALLSSPQLQAMGAEAEGTLAITIYGTAWRLVLWTLGIALLEADAARRPEKKVSFSRVCRSAAFNSNTVAAFAGLAIALSGTQGALFGGPLAFLRDACANVAKASHAMLLLTLGAALWPIPTASDWRAIAGVCTVKLVAIPVLTFGLLALVELTPVTELALAIEGCVPSALQISMMVQLTGQDARACTVICFWQHAVALVTMTGFVAVALARAA